MYYTYLVVFVLLIIGSLVEVFFHKKVSSFWMVLGGILAVMLALRYGQGTDYFGYQWGYEQLGQLIDWNSIFNSTIHGEIGWKMLCILAQKCYLSFPVFIACISLLEVFLLQRFIRLYCPYKIFTLFLLYPTFYLTYMYSALRQGLVISLFLGWLLPSLLQKKYWLYFVGCVVAISIHQAAVVFLVLPLLSYLERLSILNWLVGVSVILGLSITFGRMGTVFYIVFPGIKGHVGIDDFALLALAERILTYYFIAFLFSFYNKRQSYAPTISVLTTCMKIYAFGTIIYCFFCVSSLLASRLGYPLKVLEVLLIANMLKEKSLRPLLCLYFIPLSIFMYFKNIGSYITQGKYAYGITNINYPYVCIYIKPQQIFYLRDTTRFKLQEIE